MRYYFFYVLCIVVILGCELGNEVKRRKYVLENGTNRELKLDFYGGASKHLGSVTKDSTGIIVEEVTDDVGMGRAMYPPFFGKPDSVVVTYDNQKRQIYYEDSKDYGNIKSIPATDRNILKNEAYIIENDELYRFVFTEEDYLKAEDL